MNQENLGLREAKFISTRNISTKCSKYCIHVQRYTHLDRQTNALCGGDESGVKGTKVRRFALGGKAETCIQGIRNCMCKTTSLERT